MNKEDIINISNNSNIYLEEKDIDTYKKNLNNRLNNLKVVEDLKNNSNELLFNPSNTKLTLREDIVEETNKDVLKNTKSVVNNFIEVPVVINND